MSEGVQCREELTPPRSLGHLELECTLNWPAGCPHLSSPPTLPCLPEGESGSGGPICSLLHPLFNSSACQPLADLSKLVTACSFLKQLVRSPQDVALVTSNCHLCWYVPHLLTFLFF